MLLLRRHLLPLLRTATLPPSPIHHRRCLLSSSAAPFCLEDYLVAACGLSREQARKTAKKAFDELRRYSRNKKSFEDLSWSRLHSASNPDAVLALLSGVGLSRASIAAVVSADPLILRSSTKKIGPRLLGLRGRLGLSTPQIARFLLVGSRALRQCDVVPRLEFFVSFYGSLEKFLWTIKKTERVLLSDLETVVKPNIALFLQSGLSVQDIAHMCSCWPWIINYKTERVKEFMSHAEELGVPRSSRIFSSVVCIIAHSTKEKVAARLEFLKNTLGCSESDVATAVSKMPSILGISEDCLRRKIEFLVNEVRLEPQYIVQRPVLFARSLEKQMIPRHCIMKVLLAKGLLGNMSFYTLLSHGEKAFKLKFIDPHKDSVPELVDAYAKALAAQVTNSGRNSSTSQ